MVASTASCKGFKMRSNGPCNRRILPGMCAARKGYLTVSAGSGQAGCVCSDSSPPGQGAVSVLLDGLEGDADLDVVRERVGEFFACGTSTSPRGLLELAASAFLACGASSADPLVFDELEERYLPEWPVRGNAAHQKRRYALHAAVLIAAGVEPEDTSWWRADNLWSYAFDAVVAYVRAASDRRQLPVATICVALRDDV